MTQAITRAALSRELRALGLTAASTLMVHASLRRVGPVVGGAEAVLDALFDVLEPSGTLLMLLCADGDHPFDPLTTPADPEVGVLAEVFRQRPGTQVNDHAAARFGALGPQAAWLLGPAPLHDYYGPGSVLERFVQAEGQVLRLGANTDTVTLTHWAEYRAQVPNKRRVRRRYGRADSGEQWIDSLDDSDGIAVWPQGDYFPQVLREYLAAGHARVGRVGHCTAELFPAGAFADFAVTWMEDHL
ncbi:aminoglycoside N(3)-acetyltransferase [Deinococcus sp. RM]|uniref:aminoglycoside N(3)-acetyltransferase n=1 Tax=Deinococcus sp. RM TaxID=2316359 RepID=UPI000E699083|nr:AAC(3) family N-acetyltransferase [Deinococcus sp. RM]RIY15287.1 aminoglycoside N(3)-acetyltransferase [Deinococcus sp. RM]